MLSSTRPLAAIAALVVSLAVPLVARAQSNNMSFNVAAGLSLASGTFGDRNDAGYNIAAGLGIKQPGSRLGFRAEGTYNQFNEKGTDGTSHAAGVTLNALYDLIPASSKQSNSVYAIGGIGYYNTREPFLDFDNQTNFGWNVGGGFRFPLSGFSAYVEVRYHSVSNIDATFIPITFGLVF
ncbi:MAG: outer membrane beta-barrel protein [Gemmatimonadaceae bacterium]